MQLKALLFNVDFMAFVFYLYLISETDSFVVLDLPVASNTGED